MKMKKFKSVHSEEKARLLYPILYQNKLWYEKDCNFMFVAYYNDRAALTDDSSVRITSDESVYPCGKIVEY